MSEEAQAINNLADAIKGFTEQLRRQDPNRLLTVKDIHEETGIGDVQVYEIFKRPDVAVQKFTKPAKILKSELDKFFTVRHDEL